MPTTFLVKKIALQRIALAGLLASCAAMPAGAGTVPRQAAQATAIAANTGTDKVASMDARAPVLKLAHRAGKARLEIKLPDAKAQILPLKTDASVNPKSPSATVDLMAYVSNNTLLIQDTYASRPGPLSMCQAGEETFLRVIQLAPLKEILRLKLASCRENIELASSGLEWQPDTATLKIHWLSNPNSTAQEKTLQISSKGEATLSPP